MLGRRLSEEERDSPFCTPGNNVEVESLGFWGLMICKGSGLSVCWLRELLRSTPEEPQKGRKEEKNHGTHQSVVWNEYY